MKIPYILLVSLFSISASGQLIQSNGSGPWNVGSTWQGGLVPTASNSSQILVRTGHTVDIPNGFSVNIDQTTIQGNATVNVLAGGLLNIKNQPGGGGAELTIFNNGVSIGHLNVFGIVELDHNADAVESNGVTTANTSSTTVSIESGGLYRHRYRGTGGTIMGANYKDGSTIEFKDFTSLNSIPLNFDQSFYNFIWDCPGQTNILSFGSNLKTIRGNCTINSTGSGKFRFFGQFSNNTLSIGGDLTVGSAAVMAFSANGTNNVATIGGSIVYNSGSISPLAESGNCTLTVTGNIDIMNPAGEFRLASGTGSTSTINLAGNLSVLGTMRTTSNGITTLNFNGTSQTYSVTGTMDGEINYNIFSPADVDLGISALQGTGTFTLANGAKLRVGSFNGSGTDNNGAIQNSTTQGNIRVPGAKRSYISGSTIVYNGTQAQRIGNGHPTTPGVITELDCPNGITLVNNTTIPGALLIDNNCGDLNLATRNLTMNGANFTINTPVWSTLGTGTFYFNGNTIMGGTGIPTFRNVRILAGASVVFPSSQMDIYGDFTVIPTGSFNANGGTVRFFGAGDRSLGPNGGTFHNMIVDKASDILTAGSAFTVSNSLTLSSGTLAVFGTGQLTMGNGSQINLNSAANMTGVAPLGGPYALTYSGANLSTANEAQGALTSLTVNNSGTVTLTSNISMTGALTINSGTFTSGANAISLGQLSNSGTFNAPNLTLTVAGDLTNNGNFGDNGGTVVFTGLPSSLGGTNQVTFNHLTNSGTLNVQTDFALQGNFTNNGTFNTGTTVTFNGTGLQNITGTAPLTTFNDIIINNSFSPVSVSVESNVNLIGILTLGANAKFDANGSTGSAIFTLLSTNDSPAVDASIAELPLGAQVIDAVTVQRFFRAADDFDRFISTPVSNGGVLQLQAATPLGTFPVTGDFPETSFPCTGCNNNGHSLRWYNESAKGILNKGYVGFPKTSNTETLVPGAGYDSYMWNGVSNTTVSFRGLINSGDIDLGILPTLNSITHTNNSVPAADGWNLVGNPYPSAIRWNISDPSSWSTSNIDATVWVWDVIGRVWNSFTDGIIASGQGFWVYAPSVGPASITIKEHAKSIAGSGTYYRQRENLKPAIKITLGDQNVSDDAFIIVDENATPDFDTGIEVPKLELGIERLSVSIMDKNSKYLRLAVRGDNVQRIPISIVGDALGMYSLNFSDVNEFLDFESYYLIDSYMGVSTKITEGNYEFELTADPNSSINRFFLSANPKLIEGDFILKANCYPNPTSDRLVIDVNSSEVYTIQLLTSTGVVINDIALNPHQGGTRGEVSMSEYPKGIYFIKVRLAEKLIIEKIMRY